MNRRPIRPIDPADAPEYERDLDAYEKVQDDAGDREKDEEAEPCEHRFIDKDYMSATYGRCIVCEQLLFNL